MVNLNVAERIIGLQLLVSYKEGNFITFKQLDSLKRKLGFSEEEVKEFAITQEKGFYQYNSKGKTGIDLDITEGEEMLLAAKLLELDNASKLTPNHLSIYEKIVVKEQSPVKK